MVRIGRPEPHIKAGKHGYVLGARMDLDYFKYRMPIYEDDIFIITPPKCGTTWTQELVWLILNKLEKPTKNQFYRVPFVELGAILPPVEEKLDMTKEQNEENLRHFQGNSVAFVEGMKRPRVIKSHLPLDLLPDNLLDRCKVIFVTRNIKDMAVSYFHHHQLISKGYTFKEFAQWFRDSHIVQTPMMPMVLEAWNRRDHPNMFFNSYEDMKSDFSGTMKRMLKFLNVEMSDDQIQELQERTSITSFRKDKFVNKANELEGSEGKFVRKGIVGDWKSNFDQEMNEDWDKWIAEELKGTDFKMISEI